MLGEVRELRKKKIRLAGVCDAQREMLERDWKQVETRLHWLETATSLAAKFKPGVLVAAPLAGVLVSLAFRRKPNFIGILENISQVWNLVGRFKSLSRGISVARQMVTKDWPE